MWVIRFKAFNQGSTVRKFGQPLLPDVPIFGLYFLVEYPGTLAFCFSLLHGRSDLIMYVRYWESGMGILYV